MKITQDVRDYAATVGVSDADALKVGMEEKSREFVESGRATVRCLPKVKMEQSLKKVLSGVRQHSPLLTFVEVGLTPAQIKESIIDLLEPYFTDHSVLKKYAVELLPPEAVAIAKIQSDPWAEEMFVTVLKDYRAALQVDEDACLENSAKWEIEIQQGTSEYWSAFHLRTTFRVKLVLLSSAELS